MQITAPSTLENVARWSELAPRQGRKPAVVELPGDPQRYVVRAVSLSCGGGDLVVDLAPFVSLREFAAGRRAEAGT